MHIQSFREQHVRTPSVPELASVAQMGERDVVRYLSYDKWDHVSSTEVTLGGAGEGNMTLGATIAGNGPSQMDNLQREEQVDRLVRAIGALSERGQQIIVMYYYEELSMPEMAKVLGVSVSRISQLHTRAIHNLTRMLEREDG